MQICPFFYMEIKSIFKFSLFRAQKQSSVESDVTYLTSRLLCCHKNELS